MNLHSISSARSITGLTMHGVKTATALGVAAAMAFTSVSVVATPQVAIAQTVGNQAATGDGTSEATAIDADGIANGVIAETIDLQVGQNVIQGKAVFLDSTSATNANNSALPEGTRLYMQWIDGSDGQVSPIYTTVTHDDLPGLLGGDGTYAFIVPVWTDANGVGHKFEQSYRFRVWAEDLTNAAGQELRQVRSAPGIVPGFNTLSVRSAGALTDPVSKNVKRADIFFYTMPDASLAEMATESVPGKDYTVTGRVWAESGDGSLAVHAAYRGSGDVDLAGWTVIMASLTQAGHDAVAAATKDLGANEAAKVQADLLSQHPEYIAGVVKTTTDADGQYKLRMPETSSLNGVGSMDALYGFVMDPNGVIWPAFSAWTDPEFVAPDAQDSTTPAAIPSPLAGHSWFNVNFATVLYDDITIDIPEFNALPYNPANPDNQGKPATVGDTLTLTHDGEIAPAPWVSKVQWVATYTDASGDTQQVVVAESPVTSADQIDGLTLKADDVLKATGGQNAVVVATLLSGNTEKNMNIVAADSALVVAGKAYADTYDGEYTAPVIALPGKVAGTSDEPVFYRNGNEAAPLEAPAGTTFAVDPDSVPAGWTVTVDKDGVVTVAVPDTATPADYQNALKVIATYTDGTKDILPLKVVQQDPRDPNADIDGDNIPNKYDPDMDGDGINNDDELEVGLDPYDAADGTGDSDGDGAADADESFVPQTADGKDIAVPQGVDENGKPTGMGRVPSLSDAQVATDNDYTAANVPEAQQPTQAGYDQVMPNGKTDMVEVLFGDTFATAPGHDRVPDINDGPAGNLDGDQWDNAHDPDADGDGINNADELATTGTNNPLNPLNPDTTGDGISDGAEDWDGDKLPNANESIVPAGWVDDANGDGLGDTVITDRNPHNDRADLMDALSDDIDGDGLKNWEDGDIDGDGINNADEGAIGSDPYNKYSLDPTGQKTDGEFDFDGDGVTNADESDVPEGAVPDENGDGMGDTVQTDRNGDGDADILDKYKEVSGSYDVTSGVFPGGTYTADLNIKDNAINRDETGTTAPTLERVVFTEDGLPTNPGQTWTISPDGATATSNDGWELTLDQETGKARITVPEGASTGTTLTFETEATYSNGDTETIALTVSPEARQIAGFSFGQCIGEDGDTAAANPLFYLLPLGILGMLTQIELPLPENVKQMMNQFKMVGDTGMEQPQFIQDINRQIAATGIKVNAAGLGAMVALTLAATLVALYYLTKCTTMDQEHPHGQPWNFEGLKNMEGMGSSDQAADPAAGSSQDAAPDPNAGTDPAATEAGATEAGATDPAAGADPAATDPAAGTDPAATEAGATDPAATDPAATDPEAQP
ncbi:MAG: YPDG domain-containing protein [Corynebacterium sp.]|nr:YPDG domain-containing protein [Corynebacterium sp.]